MKKFNYNYLKLALFLSTFVVFTNKSLGFFDAQALIGLENATLKGGEIGDKDIVTSGTQVRAAVHLDPIPLIPIGFGLGISLPTMDGEDGSKNKFAMQGMLFDLEVMAWTPIGFFGIKPYVKAAYILGVAYKVDHTIKNAVTVGDNDIDPVALGIGELKYTYGFETSGYRFAIGARYSLLPLIGILFEYAQREETAKATDVKVAGQKASLNLDNIKMSSSNFMIGVEVGI